MHAIILAGGLGTRLKSVVADVPKPLAPIQGRPFLAWLMEYLSAQGITGVTLSVHHQWEQIRDYFYSNPPPVPVDYTVEEKPLGTGGGLAHALAQGKFTAPVIGLNGDSFTQADYRTLYDRHMRQASRLTMALRHVPDTSRYAAVKEENGVITSFAPGEAGGAGYINAGVYVMHPQLFSGFRLPDAFSFETDFLPSRLAAIRPRAFPVDGYFIDIGVPEDYARAGRELPRMMGLSQ